MLPFLHEISVTLGMGLQGRLLPVTNSVFILCQCFQQPSCKAQQLPLPEQPGALERRSQP